LVAKIVDKAEDLNVILVDPITRICSIDADLLLDASQLDFVVLKELFCSHLTAVKDFGHSVEKLREARSQCTV
jgi:hypothetical protein